MKRFLILGTIVVTSVIILSGCQTGISIKYVDPDDPYVGWYKLPSRQDTIIPVFKIEDTYYSVCRGYEVPFRKTSEGLEWALEPSSMVGTKIVVKESMPFIIIRDQQAEAFTSETSETAFQYGKPQFLKPIEKPSWLRGLTASAPRSNDDFIGCFEPLWFPYYRLEIRKDGGKYLTTYLLLKDTRKWTKQDKTNQLTALSDTLGFAGIFGQNNSILTYNKPLRRFEIIQKDKTSMATIPLRKVSESFEVGNTSLPEFVPVGIPTWH